MFTLKVADDIALALVQPSFARHFYEIVCREREYLSQWLAWPLHANGDAFFADFIQRALHDYADGKSLTCTVLYCGEVVGNVSFNTINHELKKVEIGYWLSEDFQGKGIASRSVQALIDIAFHELGMEKVQIAAATENTPSRKLAERLGFKLEGVITRAENLNGCIVDHAVYGLSRE